MSGNSAIIPQYMLLSKNSKRDSSNVVCRSSSSRLESNKKIKVVSFYNQQNQESVEEMLTRHDISSLIYKGWEGSVTDYFHFFFVALIPTIEYHILNPRKSLRILTDVGPFKRMLCEMPIAILEILAPNLAVKENHHDNKFLFRDAKAGEICLQSYDRFNSQLYESHMVTQMSKKTMRKVLNFFRETIPPCIKLIPTFEIVLIQSDEENYFKEGCLNRKPSYCTQESQRRSIRNHKTLSNTLLAKYGPSIFSNIVLERSSIYYQYRVFHDAKIVIAQYGAALSNIFFMKPSVSHVIEFSPPWSREVEHFKNVAHFKGVKYHSIIQENDYSDISISDVKALLDKIYTSVS